MASSLANADQSQKTLTTATDALAKSEILVQPQAGIPSEISNSRRAILLVIFCLALFTDAYMTSAMIICLESVSCFGLNQCVYD